MCYQIMSYLAVLLAVICSTARAQLPDPHLETVKQWNLLTYTFPWDWPVNDKSLYDPTRVVTTGFEVGRNRIFLSSPRLFSGVPATLSVMSKDSIGDSPVLQPYPSWSHHTAGLKAYNCSELGLVSVYRMKIDSCNRLWALDSGVSRSLEDFEVTCPPKILIYDLNTDRVVRRIDFPPEVVRAETLFTNIVVDETTSQDKAYCDDVFAYITDTVVPAIVVYDSARDLTWRISHPAMYPDPNFSQQRIGNDNFQLMDGVVGIALDEETKTVYFQPYASDRMFAVSTEALRAGPVPNGQELPVRLVGKKASQGIGLAVSPHGGSIFFSPFSETAVAKWNSRTNTQQVLAIDSERLQFIADLRTPDNDPGSVWMLSSKFQRFFLKNLNPHEINTRILRVRGVVESKAPKYAVNTPSHGFLNQFYTAQQSHVFNPLTALYPSYGYQSIARRPVIKPISYATFITQPSPRPYTYEPVAVVNKAINNPFLGLNMGEKSVLNQQRLRAQYGLTGEVYYPKTDISFNDFNGLRVAKSINATAFRN